MLHNLNWLRPGESFPPPSEKERLQRYASNKKIFSNDQWALEEDYWPYLQRIESVVSNFGDYFSFPVLFNYQRLMSLKIADLVCGEHPIITGNDEKQNNTLADMRDDINFDSKLYAGVIDVSRYGECIWRVYKDSTGKNTFTNWDPSQWFPIVSEDGTLTIKQHVLCWTVEKGTKDEPEYYLHAQIHYDGYYIYKIFVLDHHKGIIESEFASTRVLTGLKTNAVMNVRAFTTTDTVYGYDDYMVVDSILAEIMVRVAQISTILDKHADPSLTGPASMLKQDERTGKMYLEIGKFYAVSPGEEQPKYLTWEGQLDASFKQIELLLNQLYIVSEMGSALLGAPERSGQAISGTAMRFKMVNPLAKARRISNSLTLPVRKLFAQVSTIGYTNMETKHISVEWSDGLPDDPRENIEMVKLITGAKHIMPLELAIVEYFRRTNKEAKRWLDLLKTQELVNQDNKEDPNKPGPQDGTGVNSQKKGSETGVNNFS